MTARSNAGWTVAGRPGRRLIAALLLGLMALVPACSAGASSGLKPVAPRTPVSTMPPGDGPLDQAHPAAQLRVELWGDSLGQQTADYLRYFFGAGGKATAAVHAFGGTSICDWLPDMRKELNPANPAAFHPQVAVLEFNGDSGTPCMSDLVGNMLLGQDLVRKYLADSAAAIDLFTRANVPVYFVTNPLDSVKSQRFVNFDQIGQLFSQMPKLHPAGGFVRWIDAASPLEDHGRFTYTLPCEPWETCTGVAPDGTRTVTVRQEDGLHFCPVNLYQDAGGNWLCPTVMPGAVRYAMAIAGPVLRDFGLTGPGG